MTHFVAKVTVCCYAGALHSMDDFYTLNTQLVTLETTNGNSNPELWKEVKPIGEVSIFVVIYAAAYVKFNVCLLNL